MVKCTTTVKRYGTVADLDKRKDLDLVTNSIDVADIKDNFRNADVDEFDGFFVSVGEGEYEEVYGFYGNTPYLDKDVYKVEQSCKVEHPARK